MSDFRELEQEFFDGIDADIVPEESLPAVGLDPGDVELRKKRQEILNQRSGNALQEKWRNEDRAKQQDAMASVAPPPRVVAQCQTCNSPHRLWIEQQLVNGMPYKAIADSIEDGPSRRSISTHYKEHMSIESAAVRALLEEEADLLGQNYEEGVRGAFTLRGAADVLIRKGYQDALSNITTIEVRDLIQLIKLHKEMNADTGTAAVEEARVAINMFKTAIQNVLIKGDIIDRTLGMLLLQAISAEIENLRQEQAIDNEFERHLLPPSTTQS